MNDISIRVQRIPQSTVNCKLRGPINNDIHITMAPTPTTTPCQGIVVEIIPHSRPLAWEKIVTMSHDHPVLVLGQLFFDASHLPCRPGKPTKPQKSGIRFLTECDLAAVGRFRSQWKDGPRSSAKKLERLRAFFRFAQDRKWVQENPATRLKSPRVSLCPTMPYSREEMVKILAAIERYADEMPSTGVDNVRRIRGLVLLLRYSGMRIGDAVNLSNDRISGNRLFLYTQKTGVPVNAVLPEFVVAALEATPKVSEKYFFWSGAGSLDSAVRSWQTRLRRLFGLAKIAGGHAHRFRDTFAVELLLAGVPIERVSILLGHQSVRVTEKHYAPWVRSRQEQLEADLESAWQRDPLVLLETKGTPEVHGKEERVD